VEQLEGVHGLLADESAAGAAGTAPPGRLTQRPFSNMVRMLTRNEGR
jgi:hypothetical protein